jgi:pilus assembly protein CpaC
MPSDHTRFLRSVRRRQTLVRTSETIALAATALAVTCPLARLVAPVTVIPLVTVIAAATAYRLARRRPTLITTAVTCDRHLGWPDLLSTAITTSEGTDPFAAAVRATADARCRGTRPGDVPVARLGRRSWIAMLITVAAATAVTLAPHRSPAAAGPSEPPADASVLAADIDHHPTILAATPSPTPRRLGADAQADLGSSPAPDNATPPAGEQAEHPPSGQRTSRADRGGGAATAALPAAHDAPDPSSPADRPDAGPALAAGGSAARAASVTPDGPTGLTAAAAPSSAVPPWRSPGWPAARAAALAAVDAGTVPAADRALVRDYFDRAADPSTGDPSPPKN